MLRQQRRSPRVRRNERYPKAQRGSPLRRENQGGEPIRSVRFGAPKIGITQVRELLIEIRLLVKRSIKRHGDAVTISHTFSFPCSSDIPS